MYLYFFWQIYVSLLFLVFNDIKRHQSSWYFFWYIKFLIFFNLLSYCSFHTFLLVLLTFLLTITYVVTYLMLQVTQCALMVWLSFSFDNFILYYYHVLWLNMITLLFKIYMIFQNSLCDLSGWKILTMLLNPSNFLCSFCSTVSFDLGGAPFG